MLRPKGFVPSYQRSCRDVVFLVLFGLFWLGLIAISVLAFTDGEPERLFFGKNVRGDVCGTEDYVDKPFLWWRESKMVHATRWSDLQGVCVSSCPTAGDVVYTDTEICTKDTGCAVSISTISVHNRCFPTIHQAAWLRGYQVAYESVAGVDFAIYQGMGDSRLSVAAILICGGLIAFVWAILIVSAWRMDMMIVQTLYGYQLGSIAALVVLLIAFVSRYLIGDGGDGLMVPNIVAFVIVLVALLVLWYLLCKSWSSVSFVNVAIQTPGGNLLRRMTRGIYIFVAAVALLLMWFMSYWVETAAYLSSCESVFTSAAQSLYEFDSMGYDDDEVVVVTTVSDFKVTGLMWYWFFGLLWTSEFMLCLVVVVIAGAVSDLLWTGNLVAAVGGDDRWYVWDSFWRTARFNLGSVAFGSLLIITLWPFRMVGGLFAGILNNPDSPASGVTKVLCCCCICTAWCFDQCIKYTNKLAFTVVAEQGASYCAASREALNRLELAQFVWYNLAAQVRPGGAFLFMSTTTMFICVKLVISVSCGFIAWCWVAGLNAASSAFFPVLLTTFLGYFCSGMALQAFQTILEVVFVTTPQYLRWANAKNPVLPIP